MGLNSTHAFRLLDADAIDQAEGVTPAVVLLLRLHLRKSCGKQCTYTQLLSCHKGQTLHPTPIREGFWWKLKQKRAAGLAAVKPGRFGMADTSSLRKRAAKEVGGGGGAHDIEINMYMFINIYIYVLFMHAYIHARCQILYELYSYTWLHHLAVYYACVRNHTMYIATRGKRARAQAESSVCGCIGSMGSMGSMGSCMAASALFERGGVGTGPGTASRERLGDCCRAERSGRKCKELEERCSPRLQGRPPAPALKTLCPKRAETEGRTWQHVAGYGNGKRQSRELRRNLFQGKPPTSTFSKACFEKSSWHSLGSVLAQMAGCLPDTLSKRNRVLFQLSKSTVRAEAADSESSGCRTRCARGPAGDSGVSRLRALEGLFEFCVPVSTLLRALKCLEGAKSNGPLLPPQPCGAWCHRCLGSAESTIPSPRNLQELEEPNSPNSCS